MYFCHSCKNVNESRMTPYISLAPFQGITNKAFRNVFTKHFPGYDAVYSPFISGVGSERVNPSKFRDVTPFEENTVFTVPQFLSTDAKEIVAIGKHLANYGFTEMNWNMGCPFSRLANKMRGCGILPYPDDIDKLLDEAMPLLTIRLSIKCRLGYKSPDELLKIAGIFNKYPITEIIVHPRIGTQLYRGDVNLAGFADFLEVNRQKVAYNGDIYHQSKYQELQSLFPSVTHWMVGRGALINPFLASQIKGIYLDENGKRRIIRGFHDEIFMCYKSNGISKSRMLGSLKSIWYYMCGMFVDGPVFFNELKICTETVKYLETVEKLTEQPFNFEKDIEEYFRNGLKHI